MSRPAFIFLDFDGVLNSTDWQARRPAAHPLLPSQPYRWFDPDCIARLNVIVAKTGAKVVVTSSWRGGPAMTTPEHLDGFLHGLGFGGEVAGLTPDLKSLNPVRDILDAIQQVVLASSREHEIRVWLQGLNGRFSDPETGLAPPWIALDDDALDLPPEHFVRTDFQHGLTDQDAARAVAALIRLGAASLPESFR